LNHTLHDEITAFFAETMGIAAPTPDTDLFECGVLDSLTFVNVLLHLEEAHGLVISFDTLETDDLSTINSACWAARPTAMPTHFTNI
jgi:acyl carrier protein